MRITVFAVVILSLVLVGCGGNDKSLTTSNTITSADGSWTASATSVASGTQPMNMNFTMMSSGTGGMMNFSGIQITTQSSCFGSGTMMTATITMGGMMMGSGSATTMTMDMWSAAGQTGNHLHATMTMSSDMHSGSGQYTLTGVTTGCMNDSGTFTMTHL